MMPGEHGYPTDDELDQVIKWDILNSNLNEFMEYIKSIWRYPEYIRFDSYKWHVSTCGWSGNEKIIGTMKQNKLFWMLYWEQSRRGGYYIFSKMRQEDI